jgi:hypothetical protein
VAAESQAYALGADLASQRATDADANARGYEQTSALAIQLDAVRSQIAGGDGQSLGNLNDIADKFWPAANPMSVTNWIRVPTCTASIRATT